MNASTQSDKQRVLQYALAKQVPYIKEQAVFETSYGTLVLNVEESAKVGALVEKLLTKRLRSLK